ncbi:MAG TPA: DUF177 domain-containing protein, partial [Oceanospirillales bacterium]|nr:DUF177 domain-containing protein [Oceanospirillales bacterium]
IDMFVLDFDIDGWAETSCDRCLENFQLPIKAKQQLIIKFAETPSEDPLVEHISAAEQQINVAKYIYEFISLSLPLRKVHKDANETCDEEMMKHLDGTEEEVKTENPLWEALKNFKEN